MGARGNPNFDDGRHTAGMIAYVDGSSRNNSGAAGIGVVIEHPSGRRVEISQSIDASDNNYAEYAALLAALEYATAYESPRLEVYSDSEVVVRQVNGAYTCQSPALLEIYNACKTVIASFRHFAITHIGRENNAEADRLAKQAIDRAIRDKPAESAEPGFETAPRRFLPLEQTS